MDKCCSLHDENKSHTSREYKVLKERAKDKDNPECEKKDYKKKFKEIILFQAEASHQNSKYENLSKAFTKKKTPKEDTVIWDDSSDSNSSSRSESENYPGKDHKTSIAYDSDSADNDKSSSSSIDSE